MSVRSSVLILVLLASIPCSAGTGELPPKEEQQVEVAMRLIGHQVLIAAGDSTSRVLPVEHHGDRYRIRFENPFAFEPSLITATVDSVVRRTRIATLYMVEFVSCDSDLVVHSWRASTNPEQGMMPCLGRDQPLARYELWFTILERDPAAFQGDGIDAQAGLPAMGSNAGRLLMVLVPVALLMVGLLFITRRRKRPAPVDDPNVVRIGEFLFNTRNMELSFKNERVRLTSKEAELLQLLSATPNDTVERERILATVWGDEGDYVGRTLDVFVSKLRKKLEADANVRIVNIRGVGYRLVLGE